MSLVDSEVKTPSSTASTSSSNGTLSVSSSASASASSASSTSASSSSTSTSSSTAHINAALFWVRLKNLYDAWHRGRGFQSRPATAAGGAAASGAITADSLLFLYGPEDKEAGDYSRGASLQLYLVGYEFDDSILHFGSDQLTICTKLSTIRQLEALNQYDRGKPDKPLEESVEAFRKKMKLKFLAHNKSDENRGTLDVLKGLIRNSKMVGMLNKQLEDMQGQSKLISDVMKSIDENKRVDVSAGLGYVMIVKDGAAIAAISRASEITTSVVTKFLIPKIEDIVDEQKQVSHEDISDEADNAIHELSKLGIGLKVNQREVDSCYTPIIQSGHAQTKFDLRPSAASSKDFLVTDQGTIIFQLGVRYKSFCSNLGRTIFINPTKQQKELYQLLISAYQKARTTLKARAKASAAYEAAEKVINASKPEYLKYFTKNIGFSIGLEFRESGHVLTKQWPLELKKGMVFNLAMGFENVAVEVDGKERLISCFLADTVVVLDDVKEPDVLTHAPRELNKIMYEIGDENDSQSSASSSSSSTASAIAALSMEAGVRVTRNQKKQVGRDVELEAEMEKHQKELAVKQRMIALKKYVQEQMDADFDMSRIEEEGKFYSYDTPAKVPAGVRPGQIYVDVQAETVLLPVYDWLVPFHISVIKNAVKTQDKKYTYLRVPLKTPADLSKEKIKFVSPELRRLTHIKELQYRSTTNSLDQPFSQIKELRKRVMDRQKDQEAKANVVKQEELKLNKQGTIPTLRDVEFRPQLSKKKKMYGTLQAHINGLRYTTMDRIKVDVIYSNIAAAFYQPAENTAAVYLHFQLKNPILLEEKSKTKKTDYVQVFAEVVENEDLAHANRYRDDEGLAEEQEERKRRRKWNERFKGFVEELQRHFTRPEVNIRVKFDSPYRPLAFTGVASKQQVTIMPTADHLVALDDQPPLVVNTHEVEIASLERVNFGLREFDVTFIFKDYSKDPKRIDTIPMKFLDTIKKWLDRINIKFYESSQPLLWKNIMKTINDDRGGFWEDGGWAFLDANADDAAMTGAEGGEGGGGEEGEDDEERVKEESGSEYEPEEEESEEESDDGSDEGEVSDEDYADEESGDEEDDDWDELEKRALKDDKERANKDRVKGKGDDFSGDEDDDRPKRKKR